MAHERPFGRPKAAAPYLAYRDNSLPLDEGDAGADVALICGASQARTVAALKCFFRFLLENEQIDRDPAQVLRTPIEKPPRAALPVA
jgi:hypothetical protein